MNIEFKMWSEYLYVILAYFDVLKKNEKRFELWIPAVIAILSLIYTFLSGNYTIQLNFIEEVLPFVGTLLGFTLAALTLLLSNNRIEEKTRTFPTERKIRGKDITMYEFLVVLYSYLIICETILCILYYFASLFPIEVSEVNAGVCNTIFIGGVFHVLFVTLRTVSNLYHITIRRESNC